MELTSTDVVNAISSQNRLVPAGKVGGASAAKHGVTQRTRHDIQLVAVKDPATRASAWQVVAGISCVRLRGDRVEEHADSVAEQNVCSGGGVHGGNRRVDFDEDLLYDLAR